MSDKSITAVLDAAEAAAIGWDEVAELEDEPVYAKLFPGRSEHESVYAQPDREWVHREMATSAMACSVHQTCVITTFKRTYC